MDGASWYGSVQYPLSFIGATDVSSSNWAGVVRETLGSGYVFPAEWVIFPIIPMGAFTLYEVLRLLVEERLDFLRANTISLNIGDKEMHRRNECTNQSANFVGYKCRHIYLSMRWIPPAENLEVASMTRPDAWEHE